MAAREDADEGGGRGADTAGGGASARRPRAMRSDARRNRARLLEAARRSFAAEGLSVPVDEIARRAGLGAGTIHRHFPTKEALFEALVLDHVEELVDRARRLAGADDPGRALVDFCVGVAEQGAADRALAEILARARVDVRARVADATERFDAALDLLVRRAQDAGTVRTDVRPAEVRALLNGVHAAAEREPDDPDVAVRLVRVICDGLLVRPR